MLGEAIEEIELDFGPPLLRADGIGQLAGERRLGVLLDLREAGVLADRPRPGQAQLDAVVLGRVVGGGEHRRG